MLGEMATEDRQSLITGCPTTGCLTNSGHARAVEQQQADPVQGTAGAGYGHRAAVKLISCAQRVSFFCSVADSRRAPIAQSSAGGSSAVLTARPQVVRPHPRAAAPASVLTLGCVAQTKQ
jgi:hypothetical protein